MAFGIKRAELLNWKKRASNGEIAFLTHFWYDKRFPNYQTVTKVACLDRMKLERWGSRFGLKKEWIHDRKDFPHFDLMGDKQREILEEENMLEQLIKLENKLKRNDDKSGQITN